MRCLCHFSRSYCSVFLIKILEEIKEKLQYNDQLLVQAEIFHLWVIEAPQKVALEFPAGHGWIECFVCSRRKAKQHAGLSVLAGVGERTREGNDFYHEMKDSNVLDKVGMVFGQMNSPWATVCALHPDRSDHG